MNASHNLLSLLAPLIILATTPACSFDDDYSGGQEAFSQGGSGDDSSTYDTSVTDTDPGEGDGDGDPSNGTCSLDCGEGTCVVLGDVEYCECPEQTQWNPQDCAACPVAADAVHALELEIISFDGRFLLQGGPPPKDEYDDAKLWLENSSTGDRVLLGNTHDGSYAVRVTPGIYDVIYEVETPGPKLPHNHRAQLEKIALFDSGTQDIDIPVGSWSGSIFLNGAAPPADEYDDAQLLFRDATTLDEVFAGNTHDGTYAVNLVPGEYHLVYRVETPGPITPRNDGAQVELVEVTSGAVSRAIDLTSVALHGDFLLNAAPTPVDEYDDANIELDSDEAGVVRLGNTHDISYALQVMPGDYSLVYRHETGPNVPQNQHARFGALAVTDGGEAHIDIPMVSLSGALTINGAVPPNSEFDDGVVRLLAADTNSDDSVLLGNTHHGSYQVQLIPGSYHGYYAQESAGGTVPYNNKARIAADVDVDGGSMDFDVQAVAISGSFTVGGGQPPTSEYDDGRIYLRNTEIGDALLLGSTHDGGYTAIVVPGDYEVFYVQEAVGAVLPGNQNALLGAVSIQAAMSIDVDVPVTALNGQFLLASGEPAPVTASDGGQLYLRTLGDDSVLLGDSFAPSFAAKLVAGTYGVYYRSEASLSMPQNENGRFACVTVE
jgi:hypothetical protein